MPIRQAHKLPKSSETSEVWARKFGRFCMTTWDLMHVKSLEVEHSVPESEVLAALKDGRVSRDDCVRRTGGEGWLHIYEVSEFREALMHQPSPRREPSSR